MVRRVVSLLPLLVAPAFLLAMGIPRSVAAPRSGTNSLRTPVRSVAAAQADTFASPGVRRLVERARMVLGRRDSAIRALEVTWRERVYLGVAGERFRRERSLLRQERAARIRWSLEGERQVRWLGARGESPIGEARVDFTDDFDFVDPASDSLFMGSGWSVHPLSDSAGEYYRYRSGDTLRIETAGRSVTVAEVLVEPREARFDLVAGSFWFDVASGALARAAYRPARPFDLEEDEPEDADDVPGIFRPIRASVDYIVADYGIHDLRWWLPNRMAFRGRIRIGETVAFPFRAEWGFDDYQVNAPGSLLGDGPPPAGWRRIERIRGSDSVRTLEIVGGDTVSVEMDSLPRRTEVEPGPGWIRMLILVPPQDSLRTSPHLPEPFGRGVGAFDPEELADLRERIERVDIPPAGLPGPTLAWGSGTFRYNRIEALSAGADVRFPVGSATRVEAGARLGVADLEPNASLYLRRSGLTGGYSVGVYRRLQPVGDWGSPLGLGNSLNTLLLGYDDGLYYRAAGVELAGHRRTGGLRLKGTAFVERHRVAGKETDVTLPGLFGHDLAPNIEARPGDMVGLRGELRVATGSDPGTGVLGGRVWAEAGAGDFDYGRVAATLAAVTPRNRPWALAVELGAGSTGGHPPPQRRWYLGGSYTLRGFEVGARRGEAFWFARLEAGGDLGLVNPPRPVTGARPLRGVLFLDAGWAGSRGSFGDGSPSMGVGVGLSALDGLFRLDVARGVRGGGGWRLHLYSDGLL